MRNVLNERDVNYSQEERTYFVASWETFLLIKKSRLVVLKLALGYTQEVNIIEHYRY